MLSAPGAARTTLLNNVNMGDPIGVSQEIHHFNDDCASPYPFDWTKAYASVSGSFSFAPSASGVYEFYATWAPSSINGPQVEHIIEHDGGSTSLLVDQAAGSNTWSSLGQYNLTASQTYRVTITVHDADHNAVADTLVTGTWSDGDSVSASCITDASGQCSVSSGNIHKRIGSMTFTVEDLSQGSLTYDATANHDPDGDSDGTSITVSKPQ